MPTNVRPTDLEIRIGAEMRVGPCSEDHLERFAKLFTYANPDFGRAARFGGVVSRDIPKHVRSYRIERDTWFIAPRGGLQKILDALIDEPDPTIVDDRVHGLDLPPEILNLKFTREPYGHQLRIVSKLLELENILVRAPTASGKSFAALLAAQSTGLWTMIVVPTLELAAQWRHDAMEQGVPEEFIGSIGEGQFALAPLTIAMPVSLAHRLQEPAPRRDIEMSFGTLIVDEVQMAASETLRTVVNSIPARYRLGVSADERRSDRKEFLTHDAFGEVAVDIKREDLVRNGTILDVEFRFVPTGYDNEPYRRVQERAKKFRELEHKPSSGAAGRMKRDADMAFGELLSDMSSNAPARDRIVVDRVLSEVCHGRQTMVFTHRREHAQRLAGMIRAAMTKEFPKRDSSKAVGLLLGSKPDRREFERTRDGIKSGAVLVGVGTFKAVGTGINLPSVSRGVVAQPVHTNRQLLNQVRGRLCRLGSADAVLYMLWDRDLFGDAPLDVACRMSSRVLAATSSECDGWRDVVAKRSVDLQTAALV